MRTAGTAAAGVTALAARARGSGPATPPVAAAAPGAPVPAPRRVRLGTTIWDVLGFHDTPDVGGSRDLAAFERHLSDLGAKWVIGVMPRREWYQAVERIGAAPITRLILPGNRYDGELLRRLLTGIPPGSLVLPFNEPNLVAETGYPVLPQLHALDLIQAAYVIAQAGCTTLITPLAQEGALIPEPGVLIDELAYFEQLLRALTSLESRTWIREHMALAYQVKYNVNQGADPFHRLGAHYVHLVVPLIGYLDIYVTEGGYFLMDVPTIDYQAVADDTTALLATELPPALCEHVKLWGLWVYANLFQRPTAHQGDSVVHRLERTALWQLSGPTPVYHAIVEYGSRQAG
ncbi:MAG: hypothetical protein HY332_25565 [Chloroflexi bacterium]|nr:hypothetical protein [Chloroflexota bacterium]